MLLIDILTGTAYVASVACTMYSGYHLLLILLSLGRKLPVLPEPEDRHRRFLILIAARNEACVIGHLIDSLKKQRYPAECFDILVLPNNCEDDTRDRALALGVDVWTCPDTVRSKGEVLHHAFEALLGKPADEYDAFCLFDADNVVHPDFLSEMNRALRTGTQVIQGFRDSKNPADTCISGSYSIYFWCLNLFYNRTRAVLGLSAMLGGSGFVFTRALLQKLGGWHTSSMTEDMEFSLQCILAGEKIGYAPRARFYDEQPLTFAQAWTQRMRWTTGMWKLFYSHVRLFTQRLIKERKLLYLDQIMYLAVPISQTVYLFSHVLQTLLRIGHAPDSPGLLAVWMLTLPLSYVVSTFVALLVVVVTKKPLRNNWKGILGFGFFLLSWFPILLLSLFKKNPGWTAIRHTRSIDVKDVM